MTFDTIQLEKGLYTTGKSFTAALEAIDPSENYKGTALEGLDAYQRQLKRFDIKVSGPDGDSVQKFFATTDSAALFPEYVSRAVRQGMEEADILPRLVAVKTKIDSLDYRTIASVPGPEEKELVHVAEGAVIPETVIKTQEHLVALHKRGRMLVASYEAIRFQRLDLFTVTLKQIGAYIARAQAKDALAVLGASMNESDGVGTAGSKVAYTDLLEFWNAFDPYQLTTLVASPARMTELLALEEFRDAAAGLNFQGTGKMITPFGADLVKNSSVPSDRIYGIDRSCALEMVQAGEVNTDFDKLIDRQLERAAITVIAGFSKIVDGSVKQLTVPNA